MWGWCRGLSPRPVGFSGLCRGHRFLGLCRPGESTPAPTVQGPAAGLLGPPGSSPPRG